jgi:ATP-binding cassette subfamily B protein
VIFQDFARYQLVVGENIGIGDADEMDLESHVEKAAIKGMADKFIKDLPRSYATQLGTWFKDGKELSGGQWQKIALSRAFMRSKADILVLDEPTAAIDARAEAEIFSHFQDLTAKRIAIIISHRFSTVRMADHIIVLEKGKISERGSHAELIDNEGQYSVLFNLQAQGYR